MAIPRPKPRPPSIKDDLLRTPIEFEPRRQENLFLWTVFLLLLVGFSMACWIGSYLVFSRPELPLSYKILRRIKKIDPPARFKINAAPPGEFLNASKVYARYSTLSVPALRDLNRDLERGYLRNYPAANELVPYITGRFTILDSYELQGTDFVPSGVVALAVCADDPKVLIEHIYSASPAVAPMIKRNLQTGMEIELRRTFELTAVLHITKLADGRLQLTVVPLNYGSYVFKGSNAGFTLEPPSGLDVAAAWPMIGDSQREEATQALQTYRARNGLGMFMASNKTDQKPVEPGIKGVDQPVETPTPAPTAPPVATPALVVAKAAAPAKPVKGPKKPAATPTPAAALVAAAPVPLARAVPAPEPTRWPPAPVPAVLKAASGVPGQSSGVSLQPFFAPSAPNAPATATGGPARTWTLYPPGRQPGGKNIHPSEIAALSQQGGLNGQAVYLSGNFLVSAVGENRPKGIKNAVLRPNGESKVRVIVEYPASEPLPSEGSRLDRDADRPYQVMDVRQTVDGTLNVFAREVTEP